MKTTMRNYKYDISA